MVALKDVVSGHGGDGEVVILVDSADFGDAMILSVGMG